MYGKVEAEPAEAPVLRKEPSLASAVVATVLAYRAEKRHTVKDEVHVAIESALLR